MKTKIEIDSNFELRDDPEFTRAVKVGAIVGVVISMTVSGVILYLFLSLLKR